LKGKDDIKDLFQKELGNYQAKVDPSLWNGIQAGIGSSAAATGVGSSIGLVGKIIIGTSIAAAITVGTILVVNNKSPEKNAQIATDVNAHDSLKKQTVEKEKLTIDKINTENIAEKSINQKELKEDNNTREQENREKSTFENTNIDFNTESNNLVEEKDPKENLVILQKVPLTAPSHKLENNEIKDEENNVDLSKVNIQITKQNNQYVNFSALEVPENAHLSWSFGDGNFERGLNPEHFYADAGEYDVVLNVELGTQKITKNIQVNIQLKGIIGELPNIFTPNGDGKNDEFFIESKYLKKFQLTVLDNNQTVLYTTNDPNFRWNGLDKNGIPVKEGNYVYMIVAEDEAGNIISKYQRLNIQR